MTLPLQKLSVVEIPWVIRFLLAKGRSWTKSNLEVLAMYGANDVIFQGVSHWCLEIDTGSVTVSAVGEVISVGCKRRCAPKCLRGRSFKSDFEISKAKRTCFQQRTREFFQDVIRKQVHRWDNASLCKATVWRSDSSVHYWSEWAVCGFDFSFWNELMKVTFQSDPIF